MAQPSAKPTLVVLVAPLASNEDYQTVLDQAFLQTTKTHLFYSTQEGRWTFTNLEPQVLQQVSSQAEVQDGDSALDHESGESRLVDGQFRPQGCILSCTNPVQSAEVLEVLLAGTDLSVSGSVVWSVHGSICLHYSVCASHCISQEAEDPDLHVYVDDIHMVGNRPQEVYIYIVGQSDCPLNIDRGGLYYQP